MPPAQFALILSLSSCVFVVVVFVLFWVCVCERETRVLIQGFALAKQDLSHTSSPFCCSYFGNGMSQTIFLG
jgi:hypothetical protein